MKLNVESVEETVKGQAVLAGGVRIIPLARWSRRVATTDSTAAASWVLEPIGIQVRTATEAYALDLDGARSDELASL